MVLCHCGCLGLVLRVPAVKGVEKVVFLLVRLVSNHMFRAIDPMPVGIDQHGVPVALVVYELFV